MHSSGNTSSAQESILLHDLQIIICRRYFIIRRTAHAELLKLCWQTGHLLNQRKASATTIRHIAARLTIIYGRFFTAGNLKKMQQFATQFPNFTSHNQLPYFLSWPHVLLLLTIKEPHIRQFYTDLKIQQGLRVQELKQQIAAQVHEHSSRHKKDDTTTPLQDLKLLALNDQSLPDFFPRKTESAFHQLLMPTNIAHNKNHQVRDDKSLLINDISTYIKSYRQQNNTLLNLHFNLMLWETGSRINQHPAHHPPLISNIAKYLATAYDNLFSEELLLATSRFANALSDIGTASWIASLLSWQHIQALLSCHDINALIFYTKWAVEKGAAPITLKKEIAKNTFDQIHRSQKYNAAIRKALSQPVKKTTTQTTGRRTTTITTVDYSFTETTNKLPVFNLFKNPNLLRFITIPPPAHP